MRKSTQAPLLDVLIIGGGPSGSAAGAALARAGKTVRILEPSDFLKPRIGESLLPACNPLLKKIGAWETVKAAGFIRKYGAEFETADGETRVHNVFSEGLVEGQDSTFQVERPRFDRLLLQHAVGLGCELDSTSEISRVQAHPNHLELLTKAGERLQSRWLIDASGRRQFLGKHWKLATESNPYPSRVAVFNHFRKVERADGPAGGNIIITRQKDGWFWQIPISRETTSVGFVDLSERMRRSKTRPRAWFDLNVKNTPSLAKRLKHAEPIDDFKTTTDYAHMFEDFCGGRFFLVGDAATFSDPIFSSGVYLGLESAVAASEAIINAGDAPLSTKSQRQYTKQLKKRTQIMRELIDIFYSDTGFAVFMAPTNKLKLFAAVNSVVAGNTRPDFPVRWRYQLFKMICRWNRHYRLAPRIL